MKIIYWLVLIIAIIVVTFNIYIIKQNEVTETMRDCILQLHNRDSVKNADHEVEQKIRFYELENNGKRLFPQLKLSDVEGHMVSLSQIINSNKLVLRYSELNCNTCVNKQLEILNSYVDSIGTDNIVLLSNYDSDHYMKQFKMIANIKFRIYNIGEEMNELIPDIERPYFFVIESDLRTNNMYIPQIDESKVTKAYLHRIVNYYFTQKAKL